MTVDIGHEIPIQSQFAICIVSFLGREKVFFKSTILGNSIVSVENYTYKEQHILVLICFSKMRTLSKVEWVGEGMDLIRIGEKMNVIKTYCMKPKE